MNVSRSETLSAIPSDPDSLPIQISLFKNKLDADPFPEQLTWGEFKRKYFRSHAIDAKKDGDAFSPVSYLTGSSRGAAGVDQVYCGVFDIEHAGPVEAWSSPLDGYAYVLHTSYSHTSSEPRYRVIVPFTNPVASSTWATVWPRLNLWIGGINDVSTKDASRLYYLPSQPHGVEGHFIRFGDGELLDVERLPHALPTQLNSAALTQVRPIIESFEEPGGKLSPADGLARVVERCRFMAYASDAGLQPTLGRPLWRAMLTNAACFEESRNWIHAASGGHPEYSEERTDVEIESTRKFGKPVTCDRIRADGFSGCPDGGCTTPGGHVTRAPAGLWAPHPEVDPAPLPVGVAGSNYVVAGRFRVCDQGLYVIRQREGNSFETRIASRIELLALTVDDDGRWGFEVSMLNPDGQSIVWTMPREQLAQPGTFRTELLSRGADVYPAASNGDDLYAYFLETRPTARTRKTLKAGWHTYSSARAVFVLPNETIGETAEKFLLQSSNDARRSFCSQGTLDEWKREVASKCCGNSRLILATCAAFVGPLLQPLGEENGGVHLVGPSSIGKTTAVQVAASVWGPRQMFVKTWRTTSNGLEAIAARHNDSLLILDEISQVPAAEAGDIAYMLGNGLGRARATRDAGGRDLTSWRVFYLSTGERNLSEHMGTMNRQVTVGQEVRLVNVHADARRGHGLFENLHGAAGGHEFSTAMKVATGRFFGTAGPAFVASLCGDRQEALIRQVSDDVARFANERIPGEASGQVHRVGRRFGLLAAVGELVARLGVVPWEEGAATRAAYSCFESWMEHRGGSEGNQEETQAIERVRRFLEQHGESRFTAWEEAQSELGGIPSRPTINRAGFRRRTDDFRTEFYLLPAVFREEVCQGLNARQVVDALVSRGLLECQANGTPQKTVRLPGIGTKRVYLLKPEILTDPGDE